MSSATVNAEFSASYPTGFNRNNSVAIGVADYNKKYGAWYGYLNNNDIFITLAVNIIVRTASDLFVGARKPFNRLGKEAIERELRKIGEHSEIGRRVFHICSDTLMQLIFYLMVRQ